VWIRGKTFQEAVTRVEFDVETVSQEELEWIGKTAPDARVFIAKSLGFFPRKCLVIEFDMSNVQKAK
jgi:beta-phosphoglucomutase-like phosphatase (HAD superfamily)